MWFLIQKDIHCVNFIYLQHNLKNTVFTIGTYFTMQEKISYPNLTIEAKITSCYRQEKCHPLTGPPPADWQGTVTTLTLRLPVTLISHSYPSITAVCKEVLLSQVILKQNVRLFKIRFSLTIILRHWDLKEWNHLSLLK